MNRNFILTFLSGFALAGCATNRPADEGGAPNVSRRDALRIAESYLNHEWKAAATNVFHGNDARGVRVDTPDISFRPLEGSPGWWLPGKVNRSVPYQWGGFCTLKEFDAGVAKGLAAGDVYTMEKRRRLDDAVSEQAVGIDCSGFISRCWKLPRSYSTRELPGICDPLKGYDDLRPGDILNLRNAHVLLFAGWVDGSRQAMIGYETGSPPTWKVMRNRLDRGYLEGLGYLPYRNRNIAD